MNGESLPRYEFRTDMPGIVEMARFGMTDMARVIPARILSEPAVQLPSPRFGPRSPLVVADPELARMVLADKAGKFGRDRLMQRLMRRSWGNGLAASAGIGWREQRHAAQGFFRTSVLETQLAPFRQATADVVRDVRDGETIDLQMLSGRIIARILLSVLADAGGIEDPDRLADLLPAYMKAIARFSLTDLLLLPEVAHDLLAGVPGNPAVASVRRAARGIAEARADDEHRGDLVDCLLGAGPVEDNIRGLIPAAMDTTVKGLTWTLYLLARNPALQDDVAKEKHVGIPARHSCIGRTVQESLRLYPPASFLIRTAIEDLDLGDFPVRKRQSVIVAIYAMHRHAARWKFPDRFDPDRFARGAESSPAYIPFGIGPRSCVAAQFALTEIMIVASEVCRHLRLEATASQPGVGLQVTTHPIGPVMALAHLRGQYRKGPDLRPTPLHQ